MALLSPSKAGDGFPTQLPYMVGLGFSFPLAHKKVKLVPP